MTSWLLVVCKPVGEFVEFDVCAHVLEWGLLQRGELSDDAEPMDTDE